MKLTARTLSGQVCDIEVEGQSFSALTSRRGDVADLPWIAPGLIDIQINGFGGIDFNRALESDDAWHHATQQLYVHGCTGFLIALITNTEAGYRDLLKGLTSRVQLEPRNCLGFHMEGPWLNPDPGYRGAHQSEWMSTPELRLLRAWQALAGPLLRVITLAPELDIEIAERVIRDGTADGIRFFVGHSSATGPLLARAVDAGAVAWTHLGNAVPATVPKFDNVIMHTLAEARLLATLIPDGVHLPPHAFSVLARALDSADPSRLLLTTDAMAGAGGSKPARYTLGEVEVEIGQDGAARLPGSGRLAGSTLTPFQGARLAERMSGLPLVKIWPAFSTRPAALLGLAHDLAVGQSADFVLLSPEETPSLLATYHRGACVYETA